MNSDDKMSVERDAIFPLLRLLALGEQDISLGRTRPAREVIAELRSSAKTARD